MEEKLEQYKQNLLALEKSKASKVAELKEAPINKGATDAEAKQAKSDAVKATNKKAKASETGETKGMTAWDFDDTLATTKSNVPSLSS